MQPMDVHHGIGIMWIAGFLAVRLRYSQQLCDGGGLHGNAAWCVCCWQASDSVQSAPKNLQQSWSVIQVGLNISRVGEFGNIAQDSCFHGW